eukprot:TRINITY_DN1758_c0_g1_i1.p1 TRINITY_DN1758_c0_g1~~TRINITY_DN1758_c0_g1_i1.p1  ORF type:complete len:268 (-),score=65.79 TRINITY_DN1758_c0_g1_i1:641-1444(-)
MSLLSKDDMASLLVFESLTKDWVREVHTYSSKRKRGKTFVIFRNYRSKTISTLEELRLEFDDASFLDNISFTSGHSHDIVSNKVGAGKIARKAAKKWMEESANRPTENITKIEVKNRNVLKEKVSVNKDMGTRKSIIITEKQNPSNDLKANKKQKESPVLLDANGFFAPTQPLLAEEKFSAKDNKIEQQTNDVFKSKELELHEDKSERKEIKIPPLQKKICSTYAESYTPKNQEIRKESFDNSWITHKGLSDSLTYENNKTFEKKQR